MGNTQTAGEAGLANLSRDLVNRISDTLDEPDYMRTFRRNAFDLYEQLPVPSGQNSEEWRRTDVTDLDLEELLFGDGTGDASDPLPGYLRAIQESDSEPAGRLLEHNLHVASSHLNEELREKGVVLCSMAEAVREYPRIVEERFMTEALELDVNKFSALHGALWTGGTFVYVPRNVEVEDPLEIHSHVDRDGLSILDHTLIVVGSNSRVNVVESHNSDDSARRRALNVSAVEIYAGDGSNVNYSHIQDLGQNYYDLSMRRGVCDSSASLNWITGTLGAQKCKTSALTKLLGEGSETFLYSVMLGTGDQHIDSDISTIHDAPYTTDEMLARGVVLDNAKGIFRGVIDMKKGCRKSKGSLHERAMMVGDGPEADAVPEMTINENDVKAAHSASVGELDPKQLLYMQSRGISEKKARRLIILGFFEPILEKLPVDRVRDNIVNLIHRKLDEANV